MPPRNESLPTKKKRKKKKSWYCNNNMSFWIMVPCSQKDLFLFLVADSVGTGDLNPVSH